MAGRGPSSRELAAAALFAATAAGTVPAAAGPDLEWSAGASVHWRQLSEFNAAGTRIVRERGPMVRGFVGARLPLAGGGDLAGELSLAGGSLDYSGFTQPAGLPIETSSRHRDVEGRMLWRPVAPGPWGQGGLGLRWLAQERDIAGTPIAAGLHETSTLWMPGVTWTSPAWPLRGTLQAQVEAQAWVSASHRLRVGFNGLFDDASFRAGRRHELVLRAHLHDSGSAWRWTAEWAGAWQRQSGAATLTRAGAAVGTVRHPRIRVDEFALRASRSF